MTLYLKSGEEFIPSKNELLTILLYLKGAFSPDTFNLFEFDQYKRSVLVESFEKPFLYMKILSDNKQYPDFTVLENNLDNMSFSDCAQYMLFYLRLSIRQGGGESFVSMWKNGIIESLINKMLDSFNYCPIK